MRPPLNHSKHAAERRGGGEAQTQPELLLPALPTVFYPRPPGEGLYSTRFGGRRRATFELVFGIIRVPDRVSRDCLDPGIQETSPLKVCGEGMAFQAKPRPAGLTS